MKREIAVGEMIVLDICIAKIIETSNELNGGIIVKLYKNARLIRNDIEDFEKAKDVIVVRYADKDEAGQPLIIERSKEELDAGMVPSYRFTKDGQEKVTEEINALLEAKKEIEFAPLKLSVFETLNFDTSKISGLDIFTNYMIDEDN